MIIAKHFEFEAAHQLPDIECYGKCKNLHGHTYKLIVEVNGEVNELGWVINFKDLKKIIHEQVIEKYDHTFLNDFFTVSTAENIVNKIKEDIEIEVSRYGCTLYSITLYETSNSYAKIICE